MRGDEALPLRNVFRGCHGRKQPRHAGTNSQEVVVCKRRAGNFVEGDATVAKQLLHVNSSTAPSQCSVWDLLSIRHEWRQDIEAGNRVAHTAKKQNEQER